MQGLGLPCRKAGLLVLAFPSAVAFGHPWATYVKWYKLAYLLGQVLVTRGSKPGSVLAQSAH